MAKITSQACRKPVKCSKCGRVIGIGERYLKAIPYRLRPIIRCGKCGLKQYETSTSEYVKRVGAIVEEWQELYGTGLDAVSSIIDDLTDILEECEDGLEAMPEQLQYGSIQEQRVESLRDTINDLESIDWDTILSDNEYDKEAAQEAYEQCINDSLYILEY